MSATWAELGLSDEMVDVLMKAGFTAPTDVQVAAVPPACRGACGNGSQAHVCAARPGNVGGLQIDRERRVNGFSVHPFGPIDQESED